MKIENKLVIRFAYPPSESKRSCVSNLKPTLVGHLHLQKMHIYTTMKRIYNQIAFQKQINVERLEKKGEGDEPFIVEGKG